MWACRSALSGGPKSAGLTRCRAGAGSAVEIGDRRPRLVVLNLAVGPAIDQALDRLERRLAQHGLDRLDDRRLAFAHHHGVEAVVERFVGQQRGVRSAGDQLRAAGPQARRQPIGLFDQRRHERHADHVGPQLPRPRRRSRPTCAGGRPRWHPADAPDSPPFRARPPASACPSGNCSGSASATADRSAAHWETRSTWAHPAGNSL